MKAHKKHDKPTRRAKGGKFHHKMKRHYDDGGDIDVGNIDLGGASAPNIDDSMSFGTAFKMARAAGKPTFPWRGKTYTTQMAGPKASVGSLPETTVTASHIPSEQDLVRQEYAAARAAGQGGPRRADSVFESGRFRDLGDNDKEAMRGVAALGGTAALGLAAAPMLGAAGAEGYLGEEGTAALRSLARRGQLQRNLAARRANRPIQDVIREASLRGAGYKKGGKIKKHRYDSGGDVDGPSTDDNDRPDIPPQVRIGPGKEWAAQEAKIKADEQRETRRYQGQNKKPATKPKGYKAGGHIRGGGCETKGKTKGHNR
jgi:hypothetical protein